MQILGVSLTQQAFSMARKQASTSTAPTPKVIPLVGKALTDKVKELSHLPRRETALGCGYHTTSPSGRQRANLSAFYDAILQAKGIKLESKNGGDGRGREASYRITVHQNGQIVIGSAYTKAMKGKPGDEFEIKLGYKHISLKAILVPRGYANEPSQT
jgi:AbrB-like transcriptional regulator